MKHKDHIEGYTDMKELAKAIGSMKYDTVAELLKYCSEDISRQAQNDRKRNRKKLATKLEETASQLNVASLEMYQAWRICEPHMKD